jgi:RNA polymerase sigma-70 factor, ECF subfamily
MGHEMVNWLKFEFKFMANKTDIMTTTGGNPVVRNTFYNWLKKKRPPEIAGELDDEALTIEDVSANAEGINLRLDDAAAVRCAIAELPVEFREIVVLREMEGFSYKEIADLTDVPIGTVISRLARARKQLQKRLAGEFKPKEQFFGNKIR